MAAFHFFYVGHHCVVDLVDSAWNWAQKAAAAYHSVKFTWNTVFFQCIQHKIFAKIKLFDHLGERSEILNIVTKILGEYFFVIIKHGHLRRGGSGIYSKYFHQEWKNVWIMKRGAGEGRFSSSFISGVHTGQCQAEHFGFRGVTA